jgi:DinB superfamily
MNDVTNSPITEQETATYRDAALGQLVFTRTYMKQMLDTVPAEQWATVPAGAPSHLAWQVGHLAVAQYGLMLFRQRGRAEGDLELMPSWLRKRFGKGTSPLTDTGEIPHRDQLLEILDRIDAQARKEVAEMPLAQFGEATDMPYAVFPTKLGALLFCPIHESIHIGQIGLIRRLMGFDPVR